MYAEYINKMAAHAWGTGAIILIFAVFGCKFNLFQKASNKSEINLNCFITSKIRFKLSDSANQTMLLFIILVPEVGLSFLYLAAI